MKKKNEWMDWWMCEPHCKIALLSTLNPFIYSLSALRTFITLLAVTQLYEEMSFKYRKSISDHIGKEFHYT